MRSPELAGSRPQRSCNGCTLCCKVMEVDELSKPVGVWCTHCNVGQGCGVYDGRPPTCRGFLCGYLAIAGLGDHWFPATCKMVLYVEDNRLVVRVDESRKDAWQKEPYYSELIRQSINGGSGRQLIVAVGTKSYAIVPQGHIELGVVKPHDVLVTIDYGGAQGWTVEKMDATDPRVAGLQPGMWIDPKNLP